MNLPRLSPRGEAALSAATRASLTRGHHYLGVEHLFLGLAEENASDVAKAFTAAKLDLVQFLDALEERLRSDGAASASEEDIVLTPRSRRVLDLASRFAARSEGGLVEPEHMLEAILREGRGVPVRLMRALDVDVARLEEALRDDTEDEAATPTPLLEQFGRDLGQLARRGRLSPVIGREDELDLLAQVLLRRGKSNPVLVGEAGVGKTAVVEGFAQRLCSDACPEPLRGKRVVELSIGSLVAGTKYRGEFEERILGIAKEVAAHPDVILFLDEIHTLVGAGATGGGESLDASNILKPALARGELRCIGATTIEEYRRHIEKDPALERRFEKVHICEPSPAQAIEILDRLRPTLEAHHQVEVLPEAIAAAVELTVRHVMDRNLPDKALDAVDQACARKRLQRYADQAEGKSDAGRPIRIEARDVASTVSQWTGIPLERISGEAARSLLSIEDELKRRVLGQDEAVRAVARTVLTAKAGLSEPNRPLGVFFFAGPTGVGKTHLAKSLAEVLFGDASRLVRIDMSEYMEPHSISKLIGAPPGYVGHEDEGTLISALRTHPHCIVLFDVVAMAHPRVFDLFLQVFDEGRLMGAQGRSADFTQAVVILTSNIDPRPPQRESLGFGGDPGAAAPEPEASDPRTALLAHLRPELVNRIDAIVAFERLGPVSLRLIVDQYVAGIEQLLAPRGWRLELEDSVYEHLIEKGFSPEFGARELRRVVDLEVRQPLARELLERGDGPGVLRLSLKAGAIVIDGVPEGLIA